MNRQEPVRQWQAQSENSISDADDGDDDDDQSINQLITVINQLIYLWLDD